MSLSGKVALVTGAGGGLGRDIALAYARAGAKVAICDVNDEGGGQTLGLIEEAGAEALYRHCDVTVPEDHQAFVAAVQVRFGALDIACNNAGIGAPPAGIAEYDPALWRKVIDVDLSGVFYGLRAQIKAMLPRGRGAIVNISSIMGEVAYSGSPAYTAAKHGVIGLTKSAALDYGTKGIRVNAVLPGVIATAMTEAALTPDLRKVFEDLHPIGRMAKPEEVSALVLWLSSDAASFCSGGSYPVDGGYLAR